MITHTIERYTAPVRKHRAVKVKGNSRFEGKIVCPEHRAYIHQRAFDNCKFKCRYVVRYKGDVYEISDIYPPADDINQWIEWDGLEVKFVEIMDSDRCIFYVHPGKLKKVDQRRSK